MFGSIPWASSTGPTLTTIYSPAIPDASFAQITMPANCPCRAVADMNNVKPSLTIVIRNATNLPAHRMMG